MGTHVIFHTNANILFIICSSFSKSSQIVELGVCNPGSQEVEAGGLRFICGQSVLCYSVKLPPAYFLKKIKGTQCILSFPPGCLRSYLSATALSQRAPAIFLFPTN